MGVAVAPSKTAVPELRCSVQQVFTSERYNLAHDNRAHNIYINIYIYINPFYYVGLLIAKLTQLVSKG